MIIRVSNCQKDLKIDKASAKALVRSTLQHLKISCEEVGLYFVSEKKIAALHGQFFQDPTPTDCISFPLDSNDLGEIFACPKMAIQYAQKKNLDPYKELSLYVIHGLLHLIGYSDLEECARRDMRKKEKSCMRHLDKHKSFLRSK